MTIGVSVKRVEDLRFLKGKGRYVGDIRLPGQCEAVVVRSPHAHANIRAIRTEKAENRPDVMLVLTAKDLPDDLPPIPMRLSPEGSLAMALQYPLAKDRVRYVGEPVALIVAKNRYAAEDAAELVEIVYEPLAPVVHVEQALSATTSVLHPAVGSNDLFVIHSRKGSIEKKLAEAPFVLQEEFYIQRHTGVPLETRGLLAAYDPDGPDRKLTVYGPTKVVHFNRQVLAKLLKLEESQIRYVEPDVGGGFGPRGEFYPEDFLIPYAAMRIGHPVRWIEDRMEHLVATNHSRQQKHRVTVGFNEEGRVLALRDEIFVDTGAYIRTHGVTVPALTQAMLPGPYDIDALEFTTHVVATNKTPTGTYRGPGRFEGTFVRERVMDMVADKLGLDPLAVREKNVIRPEQMPYSNGIAALGQVVELDSGDYPRILADVRRIMQWDAFAARKAEAASEGRLLGMGLAMFVEKSGLGPWEWAEVELLADGGARCKTGLADVGQGVKTMLAQVCSERLGLPYTKIQVDHGDTDHVPRGNGSFATRGTVMGGTAAWQAADALRSTLLQTAAGMLQMPAAELGLQNESVVHKATGQSLLSFAELLEECRKRDISLRAEHTYSQAHMTYPYGVHAAEVEVDPETGRVKINRYCVVYDVGRAINPLLVKGQLVGGMAQGLGGALFEELVYDDAGQLLSGTFMDYLLPSSMEVPDVEVEIVEYAPSPLNPLGMKGAGEGGTVAVAPAVANAICDALGDYGFAISSLPIRPEQIRKAIRRGKKGMKGAEVLS